MRVVPLQMTLQHEVRFSQTFRSLLCDLPQTFSIQVKNPSGLMLDYYNLSFPEHFQMKILTDQFFFFIISIGIWIGLKIWSSVSYELAWYLDTWEHELFPRRWCQVWFIGANRETYYESRDYRC